MRAMMDSFGDFLHYIDVFPAFFRIPETRCRRWQKSSS
jgi:hypothetical protein